MSIGWVTKIMKYNVLYQQKILVGENFMTSWFTYMKTNSTTIPEIIKKGSRTKLQLLANNLPIFSPPMFFAIQ